jgi:thiol-disulfide isomerase/thioredoxin
MVYIEINKNNYNKGKFTLIDRLNQHLNNKNCKIFIFFYMEGCGPCNQTRPEWAKLKNVLSNKILYEKNMAVVSIDKDLFGKLNRIKREPNSFPNIRFITNSGEIDENYEDSEIMKKDRTIDSFIEWMKLKSRNRNITKNEDPSRNYSIRKIKRHYGTRKMYGGKWSLKYKRSINCKRPKGFSQKQYCKYSRNKK